jgi:hypothetical protein
MMALCLVLPFVRLSILSLVGRVISAIQSVEFLSSKSTCVITGMNVQQA